MPRPIRRFWVRHDALPFFQPAILLPEQLRPRRPDCPERTLMVAVYCDAVALIRRQIRGTDAARDAARAWVATDDWDWPFSFRNLCDILELDPAAVREALRVPHVAGQGGPPCRTVRSLVGYIPQPRLPRSWRDRERKQRARQRARAAARQKAASSTPSSAG